MSLGIVVAIVACSATTTAHAQDRLVLEPAPSVHRESPAWTWVMLGLGGAMVLGGAGTGIGALTVQSELDQVCSFTCPRSYGALQDTGRALAISTDVLLIGGVVVAAFGVVAALTLQTEVDETPSVIAGCDGRGCFAAMTGHF